MADGQTVVASIRFPELIKFSNEYLLLSNSNLDKFVGNVKELIKLLVFNW